MSIGRKTKLDASLKRYPKQKAVVKKPKICIGDSLDTTPLHAFAQPNSPADMRKFRRYKMDDGITQSILSGFQDCRKKMEYIFNGWRTVGTRSVLTFGSIFHYLLETMTNEIIAGNTKEFHPEAFAKKMTARWIKQRSEKGAFGSKAEMDDAIWQSRRAATIFNVYCDVYKKDFKMLWESVESQFDIWWETDHGNSFRLRGMRDGLFRRTKNYWLFETKTKSRIDDESLMAKVAFDFQSLFYLHTLRLELDAEGDDTPCAGVLYNVVRNPSLRLTGAETKEQHLRRMEADARSKPEHYFIRYEAQFSEETQRKFREELELKLLEFEAWCNGNLPTYKRENACSGLWNCEFLQACGSCSMAGYVDTGTMFNELE